MLSTDSSNLGSFCTLSINLQLVITSNKDFVVCRGKANLIYSLLCSYKGIPSSLNMPSLLAK